VEKCNNLLLLWFHNFFIIYFLYMCIYIILILYINNKIINFIVIIKIIIKLKNYYYKIVLLYFSVNLKFSIELFLNFVIRLLIKRFYIESYKNYFREIFSIIFYTWFECAKHFLIKYFAPLKINLNKVFFIIRNSYFFKHFNICNAYFLKIATCCNLPRICDK